MISFRLFLTFLKIGAVSFGGGYGMISLIREEVLSNGWLTEEQLLRFIAVSESTPGPIAVNMATFIGSSQAGFVGALAATFGVVLPSFIVILLIAALLKKVMKYAGVQSVLNGIRPVITGLILGTAFILLLSTVANIQTVHDSALLDWKAGIIFAILAVSATAHAKFRKKPFSPILLLLLSGVMGICFYQNMV